MAIAGIDHTAIAVRNMDEALRRYNELLGLKATARAKVPDQNVEIAFLFSEGTKLELICPTSEESGVARFLEKHGEALHHIGVLVEDIRVELGRLEAQGVELHSDVLDKDADVV